MRRTTLNNIIAFIVTCSLIFISSCKDDNIQQSCNLIEVVTPFIAPCKLTSDIDSIKFYIQGRWTWLQEERVQRGQPTKYLTPKTEGYSLDLEFKNDVATYYNCGNIENQYKFAIIRWKDVPDSGTNGFPEGEWPVLIYYDLSTGLRVTDVPLQLCDNFCVLHYQYVSSVVGPYTWKRVSN